MKYIIILTAVLQSAAGAAPADCPTRDTLATGIRFTLATGETDTYRAVSEGVVEALFDTGTPPVSRVLLGQGIYLLELIDLTDGKPDPKSRTTYSYPVTPADMPRPDPGGRWSVTAAALDQGEFRSEVQVYDFGAATSAGYGACSYDMIPITITYPGDDNSNSDTLHYLPALGLSYLAGSTYDGNTDVYDYIDIEAVN